MRKPRPRRRVELCEPVSRPYFLALPAWSDPGVRAQQCRQLPGRIRLRRVSSATGSMRPARAARKPSGL
jgi:hypothetical protein